MNTSGASEKLRLLIVDDNRAIHEDFRKILAPDMELKQLEAIEADLFGTVFDVSKYDDFEIDSAYQGEEGLMCVTNALKEERPYSLAFIDMRMPPGWDGIETIERIWMVDPQLQIVICSAYSDHSWAEISQRLGHSDRLLVLKKPFDNIEILQMAYAMSRKCQLLRAQLNGQHITDISDETHNMIGELQTKQEALNAKWDSPILEIKESVNVLQISFEKLSSELDYLREAFSAHSTTKSERAIKQLLSSKELPELEKNIPDIFQHLRVALEKVNQNNHKN
jgi:CheY-like chemotaxis protein